MSKIQTMPLTDYNCKSAGFSPTLRLVGDYWVGDPCYVFSEKDWDELCNQMFPNGQQLFDDSEQVRVVLVDGNYCFLFGTSFGDGVYPLRKETWEIAELGVDAGMLSMIPKKLLRKKDWGKSKAHGKVIRLDGSPRQMKVVDGDFTYGEYSIITSE